MFLVACRLVSVCVVLWVCCLRGGNCIGLGLFGERRRGLFVRYFLFSAPPAFASLVSALRLERQVWSEVSYLKKLKTTHVEQACEWGEEDFCKTWAVWRAQRIWTCFCFTRYCWEPVRTPWLCWGRVSYVWALWSCLRWQTALLVFRDLVCHEQNQ